MQITAKEAKDLADILANNVDQPKHNRMMLAVTTYYCKNRLVMPQIPPFKKFKKLLESHISDVESLYIEMKYTA